MALWSFAKLWPQGGLTTAAGDGVEAWACFSAACCSALSAMTRLPCAATAGVRRWRGLEAEALPLDFCFL